MKAPTQRRLKLLRWPTSRQERARSKAALPNWGTRTRRAQRKAQRMTQLQPRPRMGAAKTAPQLQHRAGTRLRELPAHRLTTTYLLAEPSLQEPPQKAARARVARREKTPLLVLLALLPAQTARPKAQTRTRQAAPWPMRRPMRSQAPPPIKATRPTRALRMSPLKTARTSLNPNTAPCLMLPQAEATMERTSKAGKITPRALSAS